MRSSAGGDVGPSAVKLRRILLQDRGHRVGGGVALERALAASASRRARRRARRGRCARRPPGRAPAPAPCSRRCPCTVPGSVTAAHRFRWRRCRRPASDLREAEVENLDLAVGERKMFSGFRSRWTMPLSCAAARPRAICIADVDGLAHRHRAAAQPLAQRLAFEQLGDGVDTWPSCGAGVVRWRGCSGARARRRPWPRARSARSRSGSLRKRRRQDLDGDVAVAAACRAPGRPRPCRRRRWRRRSRTAEAGAGSESHAVRPIIFERASGTTQCPM